MFLSDESPSIESELFQFLGSSFAQEFLDSRLYKSDLKLPIFQVPAC